MTARAPKDDEERIKAMMAIMNGQGRSIADVIEELTGETPTEETVEAVTNRLRMAQENGENIDLAELVKALNHMADQWA
jgi:uncharacterized ParB-like nuclease family protein